VGVGPYIAGPMPPDPTSRLLPRVFALCACLVGTVALAYVMPSSSILRRLVERREALKLTTLRVSGTAVFPRASAGEAAGALGVPSDADVQVDAVFSIRFPGRCRFEVSVPEGGRLAAVSAHGKRRLEGKEVAAVTQAVAQVCPLLALRAAAEGEGRASVERHLRSVGIEDRTTALSRLDGKIVYVVGRKDLNAQFWVYKEGFQPARVMFKDAQGASWDVRFKDYGSAVTGEWFPRVVEVRSGDKLLLRFTSLDADARAELPEALF
jgi:hypothetical protein